jgi:putative FmdB family regulatory protein
MPVYEYECKQCGSRFEKMQPITAEPLSECVNCGQGPIRRVFQPVGVIFKGSGWYITDNRNSSKSTPEKSDGADKSTESSGGGEATAKSDAPSGSDASD